MARQLIIAVLLLLGLGAIHTAGTHRALAPKPSDDPYAWLGPVPANIDDMNLRLRWMLLVHGMVQHAQVVDVRRFVCRSPAEVGTLPMMRDVARYVDRLPESREDDGLADGLAQAAVRGNWLARTLMLSALRDQSFDEETDVRKRFRIVQLAEWLHARRFGQLYAELEEEGLWHVGFGKQGNDPSGFMTVAAMHQDHAAQASVGNMLVASDDPELISAGGRMLVCAASARAFYRKAAGDRGGVPPAQVAARNATRAQE